MEVGFECKCRSEELKAIRAGGVSDESRNATVLPPTLDE